MDLPAYQPIKLGKKWFQTFGKSETLNIIYVLLRSRSCGAHFDLDIQMPNYREVRELNGSAKL